MVQWCQMVDSPGDPKAVLLARIVDDVALNGLGDRSLRDLATAVGSSHRMLIYHFGSREGLVTTIVGAVEGAQRELMSSTDSSDDPHDVARDVWQRVSDPQMRPFVQLFFEAVAYASRMNDANARRAEATPRPNTVEGVGDGGELTTSWIDEVTTWSTRAGHVVDPVDIRLGIAVTRGLLVDVISGGDVEGATLALERFLSIWSPLPPSPKGKGRRRVRTE
jgi:AcrR family transcriptional regulator